MAPSASQYTALFCAPLTAARPTTMLLSLMPGPKALRALIDACHRANRPPSAAVIKGFRAAVDSFEELLLECAGSISQLKRRMAAPIAAAGHAVDQSNPELQEALFHAARRLAGRQTETISSIGLYDDVAVAEEELRHVRITGHHAIVARPDGVPMVVEAFDGVGQQTQDRWQRTPALVREFTSAHWTTIDLPRSRGFASRAMEISRSDEPSDVCFYTSFPVPHPRTLDNPIEESWFMLYSPTKTLVFDLYLHESIARRCLVSLDIHLWQTSFANSPHGKWHTRMPQTPTITQLGRGMNNAESQFHPRHVDITREMFKVADADPAKYIGFRCLEHFPIWRAGYRFELDFGGGT